MVRPRILLLAPQRGYINPTRNLLLDGLSACPNVMLYGPGYAAEFHDLRTLKRLYGPFDALAVDSGIFLHWGTGFTRHLGEYENDRYPADLFDDDLPKIVLNLLDDVHGGTAAQFQRFHDSCDLVLSTGTGWQFFDAGRSRELDRESWIQGVPYVFEHPEVIGERYLLFPHCIGQNEFLPVPRHWRYDIDVPGVGYWFRSGAARAAAASELKTGPERDLLQKAIGRFTRMEFMRKLYFRRFQAGIHRSRVSVTCDGTVGYPIRKFFEIPAFGSVLAGRFFRNAEALGFRHGETCFHLEDPAEAVELARGLVRDEILAQRVAANGQEMVREFHSVQARIEQFMMLAESLASRRFRTARWEAGRLFVVEGERP